MLPAPDDRSLLSVHLGRLIDASVPGLDPVLVRAVSDSVVLFLRSQSLSLPLPDDYLNLLVCRALASLSEPEAARAFAARLSSNARAPDFGDLPLFDPSLWPGPVPYPLWCLFASRLVRPTRSLTRSGLILWTLDFQRMACDPAGWMELSLFPALRQLLERIADAWDPSSGRGVLALRGLGAAGFPARPDKSTTAPSAPSVRDFLSRVLEHLQTARAWTHRPEIVSLDFPA